MSRFRQNRPEQIRHEPMIEIPVYDEHEGVGYGVYRFTVLPSAGDRIIVSNNRGSCDILSVEHIKHYPAKVPTPPGADSESKARVVVRFESSFGD